MPSPNGLPGRKYSPPFITQALFDGIRCTLLTAFVPNKILSLSWGEKGEDKDSFDL